ncbi:unnamed protein product [Rotaria sp. Silwood1]|nr:unnamed protein product [Rotaria sp. Silwood1]CAF4753445.1 unnamed protein product [Rotaria sp. Silwood1]
MNLNLKTAYQDDESLRIWFRSFAAIALLPEIDMDEANDYRRSTKPLLYEKEINVFLDYHDKTYGRHNRWKKRSTKPHNDIYMCIDMYKHEQLLASDERQRHEAGAPPPKRRKKTCIAEESLSRLWDKLEKNQITRDKFLKGAGLRYFQYLKIE